MHTVMMRLPHIWTIGPMTGCQSKGFRPSCFLLPINGKFCCTAWCWPPGDTVSFR